MKKIYFIATLLAMLLSQNLLAQDQTWNILRKKMESYAGNELTGTESFDITIIFPDLGPINLSVRNGGASRDTSVLQYRVASTSKPVTAAMTMILAQNGLLTIDDTVLHHFNYNAKYADRITFKQIMQHASGLNSHSSNSTANSVASAQPYKIWNIEEKMDYANELGEYVPGSIYDYSNTGIDLIGNAIGHITGIAAEQMIQDSIFDYLGLNCFIDTWSTPDSTIKNLALNYRSYDYHQTFFKYSGANTTSSYDNAILMKAIYGGHLFDQKYADMMMTPSETNYKYGLCTRFWWDNVGGETLFQPGHTGSSKNYLTYAYYVPDKDITICVTTNNSLSKWSSGIVGGVFDVAMLAAQATDNVPNLVLSPKIHSVSAQNDSLIVQWGKYNRIYNHGFRLYASDDNQTWSLLADEAILDFNKTNYVYKTTDNTPVYFKLTGVKEGIEGAPSDIYVAKKGAKKVLVVDGFDRYGSSASYSWKNRTHNLSGTYVEALSEAGDFAISTTCNEAVEQERIKLGDFDMVFWLLGDEYTTCETFSGTEQQRVMDYLEAGGKLFVSGSEIGADLFYSGSDSDKAFYKNYLKAAITHNGISEGQIPAKGIEYDDFEGFELNFGEVYPDEKPDEIKGTGGSEVLLQYRTQGNAAIGYHGNFGESQTEGALLYLGFALETVADKKQLNTFVAKSVAYLNAGQSLPRATFAVIGLPAGSHSQISFDASNAMDPNGEIVSYEWDFGDGQTAFGQTTNHTFTQDGDYLVTLLITDNSGITDIVSELVLIDSSSSFTQKHLSKTDIRIYPNPSNGLLFIDTQKLPQHTVVKVFSARGNLIETHKTDLTTDKIDLSHLSHGTYMLYFVLGRQSVVIRAVKN